MSLSPPASPPPIRPMSSVIQPNRSSSRLSLSSKNGPGSRASDEEAKTSVRVAVRVRPPLRPSDPGFELVPQRFQRSMVHNTSPTSLAVDSLHGRKLFIFDRVFGEDVDQDGLWEYLSDSINSFTQGYNVSVLAYGQSGSGKSYTMGTSGAAEQNDPQLMGVIPRAASMLFEKLSGSSSLNGRASSGLRTPTRYSMHGTQGLASLGRNSNTLEKDWQIKATYVEIYNEQLRDLLIPDNVPLSERAPVTIREDVKGRILLTGLRQVNINSIEDMLNALNFGSSIRQTDSTLINAKSSRSHAVFSINLIQRKTRSQTSNKDKRMSMPIEPLTGAEDFVTTDSKLHFVDLAGSERLKNTGASGERAKEGISINAGLASLGKVISQLSTRHAGTHISYRDSKLTRLLQDSLGGNAITYMIACVTPAEFHLSETINTVQYAQRARAIQSRPQLQQIDEGDKQAIIDRLRAEVSFLRDRIRSSERGMHVPQERSDRQNERELEMQNQLLDIQENYSALSQRHARLISEITRARDDEPGETPTLSETIGDSAVERLKRSNSFAEAVEQVVLEYEKTIQSLENSLSNTRSSLASSESALLEKENKCAYMDTLNQQLQNRVQKLVDREASNEQYLHTLEAKLDGHTSGDEKSTALVFELRREIARFRENEVQAEDYISTLEERLAEADQDLELKQRELDRLEHVVERQRSLGKLDNLLYEFDHLQQNGHPQQISGKPLINGVSKTNRKHERPESILEEAAQTVIPDSEDDDDTAYQVSRFTDQDSTEGGETHAPKLKMVESNQSQAAKVDKTGRVSSTRESLQLEHVTKELFSLRLRHQSTVGDFDIMSAKYEEALRTLAELQDAVDGSRHLDHSQSVASPDSPRPRSFLGDARVTELKDGGHVPSSRSLSSELSLAGDSNTSVDPSADELSRTKTMSGEFEKPSAREEALMQEIEELKVSSLQKDDKMKVINGRYSELQELHLETLDIVEELKTEVQKAKMNGPASPSSPVIRRKSSQNVMTIDRAHRSFASLRNIAADNLEDKPDTMQSFELNLNTAMHELHQRSERVQLLESELTTVKKEMDSKMQMISGLTRERSSLKATSPVMDMSVVATMNDQLLQRETQMRQLQEKFDARESDLNLEIASLKRSLEEVESTQTRVPGSFPETPGIFLDDNEKRLVDPSAAQPGTVKLQEEVHEWQTKYQSAVDSMQTSEKRLLMTIAELESSLVAVESLKDKAEDKASKSVRRSLADADFERERKNHIETVDSLQREIDSHKTTIGSHVDRISQLEQLQSSARAQTDEAERSRTMNEGQLESHRQKISELEGQIQQHQSAVDFHKHGLKSLHDSHSREVEGLRNQIDEHETNRSEMERNFKNMQDAHSGHIARLESELIDMRTEMSQSRDGLSNQLRQSKTAIDTVERHRNQLEDQISSLKVEVEKAGRLNRENMVKMEELKQEKDTATNLVDQLEEQLTSSYEQQKESSNRFSVLNNNVTSQVQAFNEERSSLEKQLRESQTQVESLHNQMRDSQQALDRNLTNLRKCTSVASLPSPPPAIPLPPLPANAIASPIASTFPNGLQSPNTDKLQKELDSLQGALSERDKQLRQMEKHLIAEKQLSQTLEEALADLETGQKRSKADMEGWKKRCWSLEDELSKMKREGGREKERERWSLQAMEAEKGKRRELERAKEELEEKMKGLEAVKKKKKNRNALNCF